MFVREGGGGCSYVLAVSTQILQYMSSLTLRKAKAVTPGKNGAVQQLCVCSIRLCKCRRGRLTNDTVITISA